MSQRLKGITLALLGGICWGFSGVCGQYLFQVKGVTPQWVSAWRLFASGLIILALALPKYKADILKVFAPKAILPMLIFTFISVMGCQYSYLMSISASNSATATVLQYISPAIVMVFICVATKRFPSKLQLAALFLAMLGVFFMATGGKISSLSISKAALLWGIFSGFCYALYTVQSPSLTAMCGLLPVLGFSNIIGSVPLFIINRAYVFSYTPDFYALAAFLGIVLIGTIVSYGIFVMGCQLAGPVTGSLCASIEPLSSAVISFLWLGTQFRTMDIVGIVLIVGAVTIISINKK